jgi:hypothetical protein
MCLRRAPENYIAGAALDRAALEERGPSTSSTLTMEMAGSYGTLAVASSPPERT